MPRILILAGILGMAALGWDLVAQERDETVPRAAPVDPAILEEKDVPRALPIEPESPRARPVTSDELEEIQRIRGAREKERLRAEEEALRLKRDREIRARARRGGRKEDDAEVGTEPVIPRALPVNNTGESKPEPEPGPLSPLEVAAKRAPEPRERPEKAASKIKASWETRTDARSLTMHIPAPRGQIVDRTGHPIAQNKVGYVLAVKLPHLEGTPKSKVLSFARARIKLANRVLSNGWERSDEQILKHFENRRWLPLMFSSVLTPRQEQAITPHLDKGLILFPTYVRHYPEQSLAAHIVGYAGETRKLPTGPVVSGDPLFSDLEGRDGLELSFDADLHGFPGITNYLFDSDGTQLNREISRSPIPGSTVVTTLDLEMQRLAEGILASGVKRGAFIVMDVHTGEILTMASYPAFNPNDFTPRISQRRFDELQNDSQIPLFARAFRGRYPPASTFKVTTALAALDSGAITEQTFFPCPSMIMIGNQPFHNWNKKGEGDMNVVTAIGRSCNPFFAKAALRTGGEHLSSMGYRLGFGQKTGIQIRGEEEGFMPTDALVREKFGHHFGGGYLANASIGQGSVAATPLQVCQMMAAIANGRAVPQARLVKQIQDASNRVLRHFPPQDKNLLNIEPSSLDAVRRGMVKVVNASWGTGKAARNDYVTLAGKTGTGQWGPLAEKRSLAWFAGFVPYENPEYAFAVLYEGDKGEKIGGGRIAAPLAGEFFNVVYKKKSEAGELEGYARSAVATSDGRPSDPEAPVAIAIPNATPTPEPEESRAKKRRGFFNRFNRDR